MKKILGLGVVVLVVMGLVGGGTWAYFSDPEVSADNTFSAGTLDLDVNGQNIWTTPLAFSDKKPGDYVEMTMTNEGTLTGTLSLLINGLTEDDGTPTTEFLDDMTDVQFAKLIYVTGVDTKGIALEASWKDGTGTNWDANTDTYVSLSELITAGSGLDTISLATSETCKLRFTLAHSLKKSDGTTPMADADNWGTYETDGGLYKIHAASTQWNIPQVEGIYVDITATLLQ